MGFVRIESINSGLFDLLLGTVQRFILGPILYAIFILPMFDIELLFSFADDTYVPKSNKKVKEAIIDLNKSLESITKWLRQSGLKVIQSKVCVCLFHKRDCAPVRITLRNGIIVSSNTQNVLCVMFDSKLQWSDHVFITVKKANKTLNAIKLFGNTLILKKYLTF
jgi:hypothetical protein